LFDGDLESLVRSWAINPMALHFDFPAPRTMQVVKLRIGGAATTIQFRAWRAGREVPIEGVMHLPEAPRPRDIQYDFQEPLGVTRLWIDVQNTNDPPSGHVHLWEVSFH
jgi:hypothetical protein